MTKIEENPAYVSREENNGITQQILQQIFNYKDGFLYWKVRPHIRSRVKIGDRCGCPAKQIDGSYRYLTKIKGKMYGCSRLIFLYHKGYLSKIVDHRDRDSLNDKIENLREATISQNSKNKTSQNGSTSKYLGVYLKIGKYWCAAIKIKDKVKYLGTFKSEIDAALAYNEAAKIHHKEFANLNIIR